MLKKLFFVYLLSIVLGTTVSVAENAINPFAFTITIEDDNTFKIIVRDLDPAYKWKWNYKTFMDQSGATNCPVGIQVNIEYTITENNSVSGAGILTKTESQTRSKIVFLTSLIDIEAKPIIGTTKTTLTMEFQKKDLPQDKIEIHKKRVEVFKNSLLKKYGNEFIERMAVTY